MGQAQKYNLQGKDLGTIEIGAPFEGAVAEGQLVKDYIVALRENARQWSANTKGRSEVKHTTAKPYRQKGTGRARQGSLVAPQFRGGGIVFGPKPKFDQHVKINRKAKRAVIRSLINALLTDGRLIVLEDTKMDAPKTKTMVHFIQKVGIERRALFVGEDLIEEVDGKQTVASSNAHDHFKKSLANIQKMHFALVSHLNGYDLVLADTLVVTEKALDQLIQWLS